MKQPAPRPDIASVLENVERRLAATQALAKVGDWTLERDTARMTWSAELFRLFERPIEYGVPDVNEALSYFSPDSLELTRAAFWSAIDSGERCNHHLIVRCLVRERGATGSKYTASYVAPLQVTFARKVVTKEAFFSGKRTTEVTHDPALEQQAVGMLEAYVCQRCGFTEWYTVEPEKIPIGEEYATELIDVGPQEPYR